MNTTASANMATQHQLDMALVALRQSPALDGSICQMLIRTLGISESALATLLQDGHGITLIDDERWLQVNADPAGDPANNSPGVMKITLGEELLLLCEDPWSAEAMAAQARPAPVHMQLALARPGQLASLQKNLKPKTSTPNLALSKGNVNNSFSVVQFVDQAIVRAYEEGASDIHFETDRRGVGIKYRLDGVMAPGERLDDGRAEEVISRIKVLAQLDITERRRPQDGRIHWQRDGGDSIDLRVSIMPSIFGEDAVLRLLDKAQLRHSEQSMSLDVLGFDANVAAVIRELATRPHGMLLITGPTGSGKTTTVYAALSEANDGLEKIVTIEDPVEYELPGVLQIPVNEQKGLTFATGLRSILRHDPDKILVGEIRDAETAEIAIQSSLTGHLVFTTVHANSLFDVLGRFQHFGIDPFALASALNGVVVQRLLRRLCKHCGTWREPTSNEEKKLISLNLPVPLKLPVAHGCDHCRQTGYRGRFVVAEVHELTDKVRDLIVRKPSMTELKEIIYRDENTRLLMQALNQVAQGSTTLEEVTRVVGLV
ncbi:GspE/PulE family protein [Polaromonas sp. A23]|uniref:GspE/PulE family protein n=1 Tax=Polaromonas sp. A23 TaxID=1944133 RepID=UPI000986B2F9|nr:GspE/PulE family protein [Polaromonas sp. A23]OOG37824.1 GspE family protein [Polaromonas sp. A23]